MKCSNPMILHQKQLRRSIHPLHRMGAILRSILHRNHHIPLLSKVVFSRASAIIRASCKTRREETAQPGQGLFAEVCLFSSADEHAQTPTPTSVRIVLEPWFGQMLSHWSKASLASSALRPRSASASIVSSKPASPPKTMRECLVDLHKDGVAVHRSRMRIQPQAVCHWLPPTHLNEGNVASACAMSCPRSEVPIVRSYPPS